MGLLDFIGRARKATGRVIGQIGDGLKRVGEMALPVLKSIGNFAVNHHQPISALLQGASDLMPQNQLLKNVAGASLIGSAVLTGRGVGKNYYQRPS